MTRKRVPRIPYSPASTPPRQIVVSLAQVMFGCKGNTP
jgi:hypothetical protein